jgi:hypothetical protein
MTTGAWDGVGMPPGYPPLADVRAYIRVPATSLPDADLERYMAASAQDQWRRCDTDKGRDPDTGNVADALAQAFMQRVAYITAARNLPLGMVGVDASEYGPSRIGANPATIELERPYLRQVLA